MLAGSQNKRGSVQPSNETHLSARATRAVVKKVRKKPNPTAIRPRVLLGNEPWSCQFCEDCIAWAAANPLTSSAQESTK